MTPGLLGGLSLAAALLLSVVGAGWSLLAYLQRDQRYTVAAQRTLLLVLLTSLVAFGALEWALLSHDFSVSYVANHHSVNDPLWVTLVTPWAALEGSILLWGTLLALYSYLASLRIGSSLDPWRAPVVLGVLAVVQIFFFGVMLFAANPFGVVPNPPTDGPGPNPLLQNHWMMAVHPVLIYLGFTGLTVPFAYAIAAMVTQRYQSWVTETRWWTMIAWGFLTLGKVAGAWWSYEVLGWGGYWAWDPVENGSFLPWLLATAFLHTSMVQERRGLLRAWNFSLVLLTFASTMFMTFLTRSGVIESVHAFGSGAVGPLFLGFLLVVLVVGFSLLSRVSAQLRDAGEVKLVSREGSLFGSALIFSTITFVVLLGTIWPLVVEAFNGAKVSVGAPFFNQMMIYLGIPLLLLMGIGPVLPWKHTRAQLRRHAVILLVALGLGTLAGLLWGWTLGVSLAMGLFAYNLAAIAVMVAQGVGERSQSLRQGWGRSLAQLLATNRRRFGSHIVHFGVALAALAIAFSQAYRAEAQKTLRVGQTWQTLGMELTLESLQPLGRSNGDSAVAVVKARATGSQGLWSDGVYRPRLNFYPAMGQSLPSPAVRYTPGNDYYMVLQAQNLEEGWATLRVIVTPMVLWLWVAGGIIALGTVYILWPVGRRQPSTRGVPA